MSEEDLENCPLCDEPPEGVQRRLFMGPRYFVECGGHEPEHEIQTPIFDEAELAARAWNDAVRGINERIAGLVAASEAAAGLLRSARADVAAMAQTLAHALSSAAELGLHACSCGRLYDDAGWARLRYVGVMDVPADPEEGPGYRLELRDCVCRSTISRRVP